MFAVMQGRECDRNAVLVDQMLRLRKTVFADLLGWDVAVCGEHERDRYDELNPVYLVWCSANGSTLYGSTRLMPTTGPTLLYDVFRDTFPDAAELSAPSIWEATRTCLHNDNIARDMPALAEARAFSLLCLAIMECAVAHSIRTVICNYEPHMRRVYERSGAVVQELGRADKYGKRPVCCGAFETSSAAVAQMRAKLGVEQPLYQGPPLRSSTPVEAGMAA